MKSSSLTNMWFLLILALSVSSAALAVPVQNPPPPPATPEPGLLLMAVSGLALGGGYLAWRSKQSKSKSAT